MSGEVQTQSRKRRDRKKKKECDTDRLDVPRKVYQDANDDDSSCKEDHDLEEQGKEERWSSHHESSSVGVLSTIVFFLLLGGLVFLTVLIFVELKGSKDDVGPPIAESRYANILGDLVDEHPIDHNEDHLVAHIDEDENHFDEDEILTHKDGIGDGPFVDDEDWHTVGDDLTDELFNLLYPPNDDTQQPGISEEAVLETVREMKQEELVEANQPVAFEPLETVDSTESRPEEYVTGTDSGAKLGAVDSDQGTADDLSEPVLIDEFGLENAEPEENTEEIENNINLEQKSIEENENNENIEKRSVEEHENDANIEQKDSEENESNENIEKRSVEEHENNANIEQQDSEENENVPNGLEDADEEMQQEEAVVTSAPVESTFDADLPQEIVGSTIEERKSEDINHESEVPETPDETAKEDYVVVEEPPPNPWQMYDQADVTNEYDFKIHEELDAAEEEMRKSAEKAKQLFEAILRLHPESPRATYGKAKSLDQLSEQRQSNKLLEESIATYSDMLTLPNVPDKLFRLVGERCVDRMRFRGFIDKATQVQQKLINRFPGTADYRNQLAVSYLLLGKNKAAKEVLKEVLRIFPGDGFAKVHYGFILKTDENNYKEGIRYMQEGIATGEPGTIDGRFYFHLGDALMREGLHDQARAVHEEGVKKGLFLSFYQRSLYNVPALTGRPWWTVEQTNNKWHLKKLEDNWKVIRDEGLALLDSNQEGFQPESENLRDTGVWKQFEIFARGRKIAKNCAKVSKTCQLIEAIPDAAGCKRGQVKFSIMQPNTHVWAHTGPTNCRIRAHLGLVVPDGVRIRVANETRFWDEGKFIIFDDSFEHEVWHEGKTFRLVFIVDLWHPELTDYQKRTLPPI